MPSKCYFVNRFNCEQYLLWNYPSIFSRNLVVYFAEGHIQAVHYIIAIFLSLYQNALFQFQIQCLCFKGLGFVSHHWEHKTLGIKVNFISIDAEFCLLLTYFCFRLLSQMLWKLSNNLYDLALERPSLHNRSSLIALEKIKEF